jgi:hypothetical protein
MNVCVYCSSSDRIDDAFQPVADTLGTELAARGHTLVYGGGDVGLMGVLAQAVRDGGGTVVGVIPKKLQAVEGVADTLADELIVTDSMHERKRNMIDRADAFAVLPGGFGTLEEFMEVLTLKQLDYHDRALVLVNTNGFFDPLLQFFERLHAGHFTHQPGSALYHVADTPVAALDYLEAYEPASSSA